MSEVDPCRVRQVGGPRAGRPLAYDEGAYPDKDSDLVALGIDNDWPEG